MHYEIYTPTGRTVLPEGTSVKAAFEAGRKACEAQAENAEVVLWRCHEGADPPQLVATWRRDRGLYSPELRVRLLTHPSKTP